MVLGAGFWSVVQYIRIWNGSVWLEVEVVGVDDSSVLLLCSS